MQTRSWIGGWRFKHPTVRPRANSGKETVTASSKAEARTKIQTKVSKLLFGNENFKTHVKVEIKDVKN